MAASADRASVLHVPGVTRGYTAEPPREALSTGCDALDDLLGGGVPRGHVTEICGPASSGRTSLVYRLLVAAGSRGEVAALIDPRDRFHPPQAAVSGLELSRVLWIRPRDATQALRTSEIVLATRGFGVVILDLADGLAPEHVIRFGAAWPRLAHKAAISRAAFVVLSEKRLTGGFAHLCLALSEASPVWPRHRQLRSRLFGGIEARARIVRTRRGITGGSDRVRLGDTSAGG